MAADTPMIVVDSEEGGKQSSMDEATSSSEQQYGILKKRGRKMKPEERCSDINNICYPPPLPSLSLSLSYSFVYLNLVYVKHYPVTSLYTY